MPSNSWIDSKLAMLRNRVRMSQGEVAESVDVALTSVSNWETGMTRPNAKNLQKLIALYLQKGAFTTGKELEEARQLWDESLVKARFDVEWFQQQLALLPAGTVEGQALLSQGNMPLVVIVEPHPLSVSATPTASVVRDTFDLIVEELKQSEIAANDSTRLYEDDGRNKRDGGAQKGAKLKTWERQRVLEINSTWIQRCLAQTLLHTVHLQLKLRSLPARVVASPPSNMFEVELPERIISSSDITKVYDEMGGTILILGEPGSGKTFLLLELARMLLRRAYENEQHPIPVVLNLSSWTKKRLPLAQWMIEALNERYQIPHEIATTWVESEQLLPLLDGLDEVSAPLRPACITVINEFRREHGLLPLVVCSRSTDYLAQERRLLLRGGIEIQPLTIPQIEDYLSKATPLSDQSKFDVIHPTVQQNTQVQVLLSTPLMLNVFTKTYIDLSLESLLKADTVEIVRQKLFASYVSCMLDYRRKQEIRIRSYKPEQVLRWLSWLARQMEQREQSEFYLEHMQIDWLPPGRFFRYLPIIAVGCVYALLIGIIKGVNYTFLQGTDQHGHPFGPGRGLVDGLVIGVSCLLTFVVINGLLLYIQQGQQEKHKSRLPHISNPLVSRIAYGAIIGFITGFVIGFLVDAPAGVYNGLFLGAGFAILGPLDMQIRPVEALYWSWPVMWQNWLKFVGGGLLVGLLYGLLTATYWQISHASSTPIFSRFLPCVLFGLSLGLILGLFVLIILSTSHRLMEKPEKPNQGIWNLARNSLMLGGGTWLLFGAFFGIAYSMLLPTIFHLFAEPYIEYRHYFPQNTGLLFGLVNGWAVGAFIWASNGGTECTLHFILRLLLWQNGHIPWHYSCFLDYASERVLLRKTGGGYIFIHKLLAKFLAFSSISDT